MPRTHAGLGIIQVFTSQNRETLWQIVFSKDDPESPIPHALLQCELLHPHQEGESDFFFLFFFFVL